MDGVMRSWAVPRGPSLDPAERRLAVEVEDHPIEYNRFEGTIPEGEYGGGTVMIWDHGSYTPDELRPGEKADAAIRRGYQEGKLSITFEGERMRGSFALVRTSGNDGAAEKGLRSHWLLIKHRDTFAKPGSKITTSARRSVVSNRLMKEIAEGKGGSRRWTSGRMGPGGQLPRGKTSGAESSAGKASDGTSSESRMSDGEKSDGKKSGRIESVRGRSGERSKAGAPGKARSKGAGSKPLPRLDPMLASAGKPAPEGKDWVFEPKYDGVRVLAYAAGREVALISRNGIDKAPQFPEVVRALGDLSEKLGTPFVVDGEIVALVRRKFARFGELKGRIHQSDPAVVTREAEENPVALVAFDCLLSGEETLLSEPWTARRKALEELLKGETGRSLRISETAGDGKALRKRGVREGWEGIIAKRRSAPYRAGERTADWRKLKIENQQEFVVGGWTAPGGSRKHFGALLLGYFDQGKLIYCGRTGTGFSESTLASVSHRLKQLRRATSPFQGPPDILAEAGEELHWVRPELVVEVKFNEWTAEGRLRQSAFLGMRDDKEPKEVIREPSVAGRESSPREKPRSARTRKAGSEAESDSAKKSGKKSDSTGESGTAEKADSTGRSSSRKRHRTAKPPAEKNGFARKTHLMNMAGTRPDPTVDALIRLINGPKEGSIPTGGRSTLRVSSLDKVFYPETKTTKGDLFLYYARMAEYILPWMKDRPLVLRRFPEGVEGESFYQQAAPDQVPAGVRVAVIRTDGEPQRRLIGGKLATLLYTIQLGAISWDPWHSRTGALKSADYTILDLDPGPGADFRRVVEVALRIREELDELGLHGAVKTSGSEGIHIYLPLPPRTTLETAALLGRVIATRVADRYPKEATVARMTRKRPRGTVYIDFLQNSLSKSVAGVYAVRARPIPTVSTPLRWEELTSDLDLRDFTINTVPDRVRRIGDIWSRMMAEPNDLSRADLSRNNLLQIQEV
jgi:bifunctional non-homologous end joining protein LigD